MKANIEFAVQQYYKVQIDEAAIDTHRHEHQPDSKDGTKWIEAHFARLHRLFQAIMADQKALYAVVEYQVLREHDYKSDGCGKFIKSNYDGEELSLPEVLAREPSCFTQNDRAWLQALAKEHEHRGDYEGEPDSLEELADCFKVEASGWSIQPLKPVREDSK